MMPSSLSQLPPPGQEGGRAAHEDSIGSAGSLAGKENPWDEQDLPSGEPAWSGVVAWSKSRF